MIGWVRRWLRRGAEAEAEATPIRQLLVIAGLSGFALSQPLLTVLGEDPAWFTFRGAGRTQIILFALALALVPALVLWSIGMLLRAVRRQLGWWFHVLVVAALSGLSILQWVKQGLGPPAPVLVAVSVIGGVAFAMAYVAVAPVRVWTRFTAVLPPLAVASFLLVSPTSQLITEGSGPASTTTTGEDVPSVLFLMLDELPTQSIMGPDEGIDRVRFPNLAELADGASWYRGYSSDSHRTSTAVPSILSGLPPTEDPPTFASHPDNLFTLLDPTHDLRVVETATSMCSPTLCPPVGEPATASVWRRLATDAAEVFRQRISLDPDADVLLDDFEMTLEGPSSADSGEGGTGGGLFGGPQRLLVRPEQHARFLDAIEPVEAPTLWFLHLTLPHQPWLLYPDGSQYRADGFPVDRRNELGPWMASIAEQRHLLQAQYTDALVGEAMDALREAGEYDDTIVVVTADHGISFTPNTPWRRPVEANVDSQAYVPLLIKDVGQRTAVVDDSNTIAADLLPTLAEAVGVPMTWDHPGLPIGSPAQQSRDGRKVVYDFGPGFSPSLEGTLEFDHQDRAPHGEGRWIGWITEDDDPLAALFASIGMGDVIGEDLADQARGRVPLGWLIANERELTDPDPSSFPPGVVSATLRGEVAGDDRALLVLDGRIVSAAPPVRIDPLGPQAAHFLLPPGAVGAAGHEVDVAIWRDGQVLRTSG